MPQSTHWFCDNARQELRYTMAFALCFGSVSGIVLSGTAAFSVVTYVLAANFSCCFVITYFTCSDTKTSGLIIITRTR